MAFCTECGANVPGGINFCTGCGRQMGATPSQATPSQAMPSQAAPLQAAQPRATPLRAAPQAAAWQAAPQHAAPQQAQGRTYAPAAGAGGDRPPSRNSRYAVVGTGAYIGTMLLYSIPIVGWIFCIIHAFSAKNQNKKNFAKAMLVFLIIGIVLSVALYFVGRWFVGALEEYTAGMLGGMEEMNELYDMLGDAGLSGY